MSWNVFITRKIPEAGILMLKDEGFNVEVFPKDNPIPDHILKEKTEKAIL